MIFLRQAKIPGHLEDHIMAKINGSRNFSDLLEAIQVLARRPMSQHFIIETESFNDDWNDSAYVTEYYDIDDYNDTEGDGYEYEYNQGEDYDSEWIDRSDIPEDMTFRRTRIGLHSGKSPEGQKGIWEVSS